MSSAFELFSKPIPLPPHPSPFLSHRKEFPAASPFGTRRLTWTLSALCIGIGLGGFFALLAMCLLKLIRKRRKTKRLDKSPSNYDYYGAHPQKGKGNVSADAATILRSPTIPTSSTEAFSYEELARATDNYSSANILGQGGFGYVHKGVLPKGKEVAVKKLKSGSGQGEREFQAEVDTISRVQHRNLVSLVGYCISGYQRLLVYEFVSNKTMEFHLHGGKPPMSWSTRLKIALGAARGLAYLHEDCHPKIIHRDIKASNILLDDDFEAKVADFGLAKFSDDNDTHVSTRVMGTFGYLAPEYASSGKLTEKSDVYSFGVVLLELITGRPPIDKGSHSFMDDSMVEWARPLLREALETGKFDGLVDLKLKEYNVSEMSQMVACAAASVQQSARRRPRMSQIVEALEGNLSIDELCHEMSPTSSTACGSSDYDQCKKDDLKKFKQLALESPDLSTSGVSVVITDVGGPLSISSTDNQNESQDTGSGNSKKDNEDVLEIPIL